MRFSLIVDVREGPADLLVDGAVGGGCVGGRDAVDGDQQLGEQGVAHGVRAGALILKGLFKGREKGTELFPLPLVRQQETAACAVGHAEAVHETGRGKDALEETRVEIKDDALVGG